MEKNVADITRDETYVMTEFASDDGHAKHNKIWRIVQNSDDTVVTYNGRIGANIVTNPIKQFCDSWAANSFVESKIKEKLKKGYNKIELIKNSDSKQCVASINKKDLKTKILSEITFNNDITRGLVEYFWDVNIHNITSLTNITYNYDNGLFETPVGIVTIDTINNARSILINIAQHIENTQFDNDFKEYVQKYLMLIPQKIGVRNDIFSIFSDQQSIVKQNDILDGLTASITSILNNPNQNITIEEKRIFDLKLELIEDKSEIRRINNLFLNTLQSNHTCRHLRPKRIFSVDIRQMNDGWNNDGNKMTNKMELWHGSKASNILSIMKQGLIIPRYDSRFCAGRLYGNGVYFSDISSKSLNYSYGFWDGKKEEHCFMFLANVAMGKIYTPSSSSIASKYPVNGYDSTFAKGGISGVINNEMIVYRTTQCNLHRLVEFTPQGR
jgi:poly [ADP-ribose] polymerase